ncbi:MAG: hypothetical protein ACLTAX_11490 [Waltera sp.]
MHDPEGFLYQVRDEEGRDTKVRICPHCHNPLPFEYGKYPVKYIAVVGITELRKNSLPGADHDENQRSTGKG